jgi:hypothetical protein
MRSMTLSVGSASLEFLLVRLRFREAAARDVFARYRRKTLAETLSPARLALQF